MPDEEIWGVRNSFTTSDIFFAGYAPGGGRNPDTQSVPELVGPPQPKKSPEQKEKEKAKCAAAYENARKDAELMLNGQMAICAASTSSTVGFVTYVTQLIASQISSKAPPTCAQRAAIEYMANVNLAESRRNACDKAADSD